MFLHGIRFCPRQSTSQPSGQVPFEQKTFEGQSKITSKTKNMYKHTDCLLFLFLIVWKVSELPHEVKRLFKWKMCSITPTIVRTTISRSCFTVTRKLLLYSGPLSLFASIFFIFVEIPRQKRLDWRLGSTHETGSIPSD
jgi:hypothetical protein